MGARFFIVGAESQLGQDLSRVLPADQVAVATHRELDICDRAAVQTCLGESNPSIVINTAAFNRVDECEEGPGQAFAANAVGACHLAQCTQTIGAVLVHFSTNYVFDGKKRTPYTETDPPGPLSVYGLSKLAGEWAVHRYCEKHFIIRTAGLFGSGGMRSRSGNFVETMLRQVGEGRCVRVVSDQVVTPTSSRQLAQRLPALIETRQYGTYHMTSSGQCSWAEFAQEIFRQTGLAPDLQPVSSEAYGARAIRPAYSVLDNSKLHHLGVAPLAHWSEALAEYLQERAATLTK